MDCDRLEFTRLDQTEMQWIRLEKNGFERTTLNQFRLDQTAINENRSVSTELEPTGFVFYLTGQNVLDHNRLDLNNSDWIELQCEEAGSNLRLAVEPAAGQSR